MITVAYQYGSICESIYFDDSDEDAANNFYEMIAQRVSEFGDGEYEPNATISYEDDI